MLAVMQHAGSIGSWRRAGQKQMALSVTLTAPTASCDAYRRATLEPEVLRPIMYNLIVTSDPDLDL